MVNKIKIQTDRAPLNLLREGFYFVFNDTTEGPRTPDAPQARAGAGAGGEEEVGGEWRRVSTGVRCQGLQSSLAIAVFSSSVRSAL